VLLLGRSFYAISFSYSESSTFNVLSKVFELVHLFARTGHNKLRPRPAYYRKVEGSAILAIGGFSVHRSLVGWGLGRDIRPPVLFQVALSLRSCSRVSGFESGHQASLCVV
jgi:hypothetical protein